MRLLTLQVGDAMPAEFAIANAAAADDEGPKAPPGMYILAVVVALFESTRSFGPDAGGMVLGERRGRRLLLEPGDG